VSYWQPKPKLEKKQINKIGLAQFGIAKGVSQIVFQLMVGLKPDFFGSVDIALKVTNYIFRPEKIILVLISVGFSI
jgi:hypothetical protein